MKRISLLVGTAVLFAAPAFAAEHGMKGEFGDHCAMGLVKGMQVTTDCSIHMMDNNTHKTYCFSSEEMKTEFEKDSAANIKKAEEEFAKIGGEHQMGEGDAGSQM